MPPGNTLMPRLPGANRAGPTGERASDAGQLEANRAVPLGTPGKDADAAGKHAAVAGKHADAARQLDANSASPTRGAQERRQCRAPSRRE
jgi:hypothetical protein